MRMKRVENVVTWRTEIKTLFELQFLKLSLVSKQVKTQQTIMIDGLDVENQADDATKCLSHSSNYAFKA